MIVGLLRTPETSTIWCDDNLERQTQPASRLGHEGCAPTKTATTLCRTIGKLACFGTNIMRYYELFEAADRSLFATTVVSGGQEE